MEGILTKRTFDQINLSDPFFDSLKEDYAEFLEWFQRKAQQGKEAYVLEDNGQIQAFLYLKIEEEPVEDVDPPLSHAKRVKVGTFKVNPHGTRLGERLIKKIFDYAVIHDVDEIYVTIFEKHQGLYQLFLKYGFFLKSKKSTSNGVEDVLTKNMREIAEGTIQQNYPLINSKNSNKFILSIYPKYHTQLFPDSILNNESYDLIQDVSHTNSIHKVYICFMDLSALRSGDIILIYRTSDIKGRAYYRSVVTSVCVVEEIKSHGDFAGVDQYVSYCEQYSVFNESDLRSWYASRSRLYVIKMTYNAAFSKRVIRGHLLEHVGLSHDTYWGFVPLNDSQFRHILEMGQINERLIFG